MLHGSKNRRSGLDPAVCSKRKSLLWLRARIVQTIREFFISRKYLEVETPQLIAAPAPETHIDAVTAGDRYLHTSPELCMKRLLASGLSRIFQMARCFRHGERGDLHLPEFSLLEWYRTGIDYLALMEECESLFSFLSDRLHLGGRLSYCGMDIDLRRWERLSVKRAFEKYTTVGMEQALETDTFDRTMVLDIEPHLGKKRPTILYDYPASLGALARLKPGAPHVAERFEIYVAGIELANGFSELTDSREQRRRFEKELAKRAEMGKPPSPMPERFLEDLRAMPEAAGIALGLDRLIMILGDARTIDEVVSFSPEEV